MTKNEFISLKTRVRKAKIHGLGISQIVLDFQDSFDSKHCTKCIEDDFGYCGLRTTNISLEDMYSRYCLYAIDKHIYSITDLYV